MFRETSQLLSKVKPKIPNLSKAGFASLYSLMKKYAIRTRIATARAVRPQRRNWSGSRDRGGRSSTERPPPVVAARASTPLLEGLAVAGEALDLGQGLRVDLIRQRRVLELRRHLLAV